MQWWKRQHRDINRKKKNRKKQQNPVCGDFFFFLSRKKDTRRWYQGQKKKQWGYHGDSRADSQILQLEIRSCTAKEWDKKLFCHNTNQIFVLWTEGEEFYPVVRWQHCLFSASFLWTKITAQRKCSLMSPICGSWCVVTGTATTDPKFYHENFFPFPSAILLNF